MDGQIVRINADKGFGFIKGQDGQDYFFHRSAVSGGEVFENLREGQTVTFDVTRSEKGLRAENVQLD